MKSPDRKLAHTCVVEFNKVLKEIDVGDGS